MKQHKPLESTKNNKPRTVTGRGFGGITFSKITEMKKTIEHQSKTKEVREIKNPTIVMNDKDLETFVEQVENQVNNLKVGKHPKYEGIPIIEAKHIEQGTFIIYDNNVDELFN